MEEKIKEMENEKEEIEKIKRQIVESTEKIKSYEINFYKVEGIESFVPPSFNLKY